ncbi:MAG: hypothetical protein WBA44_07785 [Mesorhizobium sp.]
MIAAARGDGLHPDLCSLFRQRAAIENDAQVIDIADARPGARRQAGSSPAAGPGLFVPGNVLRLVAPAEIATHTIKSSKSSKG